MMDMKLWLSVLMFCGMSESQSWKNNWFIYVPSRVSVLESSCVDIPCSYVFSGAENVWKSRRATWNRGDLTVASNFPRFKQPDEFKGRSRITGDLPSGNCTWQLTSVRETDTGPFYLRIDIPRYSGFNFSQDKVILNVFQVPEPAIMSFEVNNKVTATCKVSHACPSSPPEFSWSHSGKKKTKSIKQNSWMWSTTSTLTFTPQEADFKEPLDCTVKFPGGKTTKGSVRLIKST